MAYMDFEHSNKVENYIRYRPSYPNKLIEYLYNEGGFSKESVIADVGSGTGNFTRFLLERGSRVVAIEPDNLMRTAAERLLGDEFQRFVSIKGTGENTTLSDASVHHIVCANSFHFFDSQKCREEFSRILKPNGTVTLIWNRRDVEADPFTHEYERLIRRYSKSSEKKDLHKISPTEFSDFFGTDRFAFISLPNMQILDMDGMKGGLLSHEDLPSFGHEGYNEMLQDLRTLFDHYNQSGKVILHYETEAYAGQLRRAS